MSIFDRVERCIAWIERTVMFWSYLTIILLVGAETLRRVVFKSQFIWGPEVALYAFIWLSWFAMSHNIGAGAHLSFGEFRRRLPRQARFGLAILDDILWLALGAILTFALSKFLMTNIRTGAVVFGTSIPLAVGTLGVMLGWITAMLRVLCCLPRRWQESVSEESGSSEDSRLEARI